MDVLQSGFSYASNELRRATKPVIDTLAPMPPTFGCGDAAAKQSASNCIMNWKLTRLLIIDPLLATDVAAAIGIGSAAHAEEQRAQQTKKRQ